MAWLFEPGESNPFLRLPSAFSDLTFVTFTADGERGWAVGAGGAILATLDGGQSWQARSSGTTVDLHGVTFAADAQRGWVVGAGGTVLATLDGGQSWQARSSGTTVDLHGVTFAADGMRGWVVGLDDEMVYPKGEVAMPPRFGVGGTILATDDGGHSWHAQAIPTTGSLDSVTFAADGERGWAVGAGGTILATRDGGHSWQAQTSGTTADLHSVAFATDRLRGWAGGTTTLTTRDGGESWQAQQATIGTLYGVTFAADGLRGWAVGWRGTILATRDGGRSWKAQASGTAADLQSVTFAADGMRGWAVGAGGTILATRDGGQSWQAQASGTTADLQSVTFAADGMRGWAVGGLGGKILATRDGGQSWQAQSSGTTAHLHGVTFAADGRRGWAVGVNDEIVQPKGELSIYAGVGGTILATDDGGQSWHAQAIPTTGSLDSVTFAADGQRGWAVGWGGRILATGDGGQSWRAQATTSPLYSITFVADGLHGWAVGWGGILATRDGGQSWQAQASGATADLYSVTFTADGQRGWAVGGRGTILATRDGGQSWRTQASGTTAHLHSVTFAADGMRGWAVGGRGTILATRDGGQSWQAQASGTGANLASGTFASDGLHGWALGEGGTILATRDGGATWIAARHSLFPAPWFYLVAVLVGAVAVVSMRHFVSAESPEPPSIEDRGVSDEPISSAQDDRLDLAPLARGVSRYLRNAATKPPFTIAVNAPWGRGKSSVLRMIAAELGSAGVRTVSFNAWHHQQEPVLLAPLLDAIRAQAIPPWFSMWGSLFRGRLLLRRVTAHPAGSLAVASGLVVAAAHFGPLVVRLKDWLFLFPDASERAIDEFISQFEAAVLLQKLADGKVGEFLSALISSPVSSPEHVLDFGMLALALASASILAMWGLRAFPVHPSVLLASLSDRFKLSEAQAQTAFRERYRSHFADVCEALQPRRMTLLIDDLDRCAPAKAAEVLEAVNYLVSSGRCFVILGISREVVEAQLVLEHEKLADAFATVQSVEGASRVPPGDRARVDYARDYLRKLINLDIRLPTVTSEQVAALLTEPVPRARDDGRDAGVVQAERLSFWTRMSRAFEPCGRRIRRSARPAIWVLMAGGFLTSKQADALLTEPDPRDGRDRRDFCDAGVPLVAKGASWRTRVIRVLEPWEGMIRRSVRPAIWVLAAGGFLYAFVPVVRGIDVWNDAHVGRLAAKRQHVSETVESVRTDERRALVAFEFAQRNEHAAAESAFEKRSERAAIAVSLGHGTKGSASERATAPTITPTTPAVVVPTVDDWKRSALAVHRAERAVDVARQAVQEAEAAQRRDGFVPEKVSAAAARAAAEAEQEAGYNHPVPADGLDGGVPAGGSLPTPDLPRETRGGASDTTIVTHDTARSWAWTLAVPAFAFGVLAFGSFRITRNDYTISDSQSFIDALRLWSPVVGALPTLTAPREVKRFVNKARYFAMRLRELPEERSLIARFLEKQKPPINGLPESLIVALAAIHHVRPQLLESATKNATNVTRNWTVADAHDVSDPVMAIIQQTWAHMKTEPTHDQVKRFCQLVSEYGTSAT